MSTVTVARRRLGERMNASVDDYEPGGVAVPPVDTAAAFKFSPNQERWPPGTPGGLGGQWKDDGVPTGKKVLPAIIYKKHADGAVVAQRGSRRLRWNAGAKKFTAEEREGDAWVEKQKLTKTAAYSEMKEGDWRESGVETPSTRSSSAPETSSETPEPEAPVVEPTAETPAPRISVARVDATEAAQLRDEVSRVIPDPWDTRRSFIQQALGATGYQDRRVYAARDDGKLAGAVSLVVNREIPHIEHLASVEGTSGVGRELLRAALQDALADGKSWISVEPTVSSRPFWKAMGFKPRPSVNEYWLYTSRAEAEKWLEQRPVATPEPPTPTEAAPGIPGTSPGIGTDQTAWVSEQFDDLVPATEFLGDIMLPGDSSMIATGRRQGFDAKPALGSKQQLDAAVAAGGTEMWRGVHARDKLTGQHSAKGAAAIVDQFKTGDYRPGFGIYGNGFYASVNESVARTYASVSNADGTASPTEINRGMMRMVLDPNARVIDYEDIAPIVKQINANPDLHPELRFGWGQDVGHVALMLGYDAVRVRNKDDGSSVFSGGTSKYADQYILLNRGALLVEDR